MAFQVRQKLITAKLLTAILCACIAANTAYEYGGQPYGQVYIYKQIQQPQFYVSSYEDQYLIPESSIRREVEISPDTSIRREAYNPIRRKIRIPDISELDFDFPDSLEKINGADIAKKFKDRSRSINIAASGGGKRRKFRGPRYPPLNKENRNALYASGLIYMKDFRRGSYL